jgi:hypothetical protein
VQQELLQPAAAAETDSEDELLLSSADLFEDMSRMVLVLLIIHCASAGYAFDQVRRESRRHKQSAET